MNNATPPDDLREFLGETYEALKLQAERIQNRSVEMAAVTATLRELVPGFDIVYQYHRQESLALLQPQFDEAMRLLDETIARLRGT